MLYKLVYKLLSFDVALALLLSCTLIMRMNRMTDSTVGVVLTAQRDASGECIVLYTRPADFE